MSLSIMVHWVIRVNKRKRVSNKEMSKKQIEAVGDDAKTAHAAKIAAIVSMQSANDEDEDVEIMPDGDLLANASRTRPALVEIRITFYVHLVNVMFCMFCVLIGAFPYYHYFGRTQSLIGYTVSFIVSLVFYGGMIVAIMFDELEHATVLAIFWLPCVALSAGFLSAVIYNITPIQFMLMSMVQSTTVLTIMQLWPYHMVWYKVAGSACGASIIVWCASIYGFVLEADWGYAVVLIVLGSVVLSIHNARQLIRSVEYNVSKESIIRAVLDHYCYDTFELVKFIKARMT